MPNLGRWGRVAGRALSGLLAAIFLASASGKLTGGQQVVDMMEKWGLGEQIMLIGIGELVSTILFVLPYSHPFGVLLLSAYMGGAIVTHMQHGESYVLQSVILALIWLAAYLRRPVLLHDLPAPRSIATARPIATAVLIESKSTLGDS